jgi:MFS family permease
MNLTTEQRSLLQKTTRADTVRACMLDPIASSFRGSGLGVLVALQFFDGADWQKGLLAAVGTGGMLLSPLAVSLAARAGYSVSRAAATILFLGVPGLLLAACAHSLATFMIGVFLSVPLLGAAMPLGTAMWQQNAPGWLRGRVFSRVSFIGGICGVLSSVAISFWLGDDPGRFRPIMLCFSAMLVVAGLAIWRVPTHALEPKPSGGGHGLGVLKLLVEDRLFGYLCIAQMLIGFGNLATIPLRTEFLGSADRGMGYTAGIVYLMTVVVPESLRLFSLPMWGWLFDRLNFAVMRMSVSSCFVVSLLCTFSPHLALQLVGSAFFGLAMGGGAIAWALWVTKLAPAQRTADYMAVHTFLTGVRGLIGPQLAFAALAFWSIKSIGAIGAGIVFISILMLLPTIRIFHNRAHD